MDRSLLLLGSASSGAGLSPIGTRMSQMVPAMPGNSRLRCRCVGRSTCCRTREGLIAPAREVGDRAADASGERGLAREARRPAPAVAESGWTGVGDRADNVVVVGAIDVAVGAVVGEEVGGAEGGRNGGQVGRVFM